MHRNKYIGKKIHIVSIINNVDVYGCIASVDEKGRFHGTWGDYVPNSKTDNITLED